MSNGDILLLLDGRMLRIEDVKSPGGLAAVLYIDRDEESYTDLDKLHIEANLGQSTNVLATFYTTRGIHLRLNRMNKV